MVQLLEMNLFCKETRPILESNQFLNQRVQSFFLLGFLTLEDVADRLSRNVGEDLPLYAT